jgi:hypothetical protein
VGWGGVGWRTMETLRSSMKFEIGGTYSANTNQAAACLSHGTSDVSSQCNNGVRHHNCTGHGTDCRTGVRFSVGVRIVVLAVTVFRLALSPA